MITHHDIIIVGAGLAGLSLAVGIARDPRFRGRSVALFDSRRRYTEDRTWCRFEASPDPFEDCVAQRYGRARVGFDGTPGRELVLAYPYARIDALALYRTASARVVAAGQRLQLDTTIRSVEEETDAVRVITSTGVHAAPLVVDTRPDPVCGSAMSQRFVGRVVEVDEPVFDPGVCDLMHHMRADHRGLNFMYVLPLAPTRALIEDTWFTPPETTLPDPNAAISRFMRVRYGVDAHRVVREERGCLPMGAHPRAPAPSRVVRFGVGAGDIRVATGYAYDAIQRRVVPLLDALDAALLSAAPAVAPAPAFSPFVRWMDEIFMRAARRHPADLANWMWALFDRVPIARMQRFLHDGGSVCDRAAVIATLPPLPFLRALHAVRDPRPAAAWAR